MERKNREFVEEYVTKPYFDADGVQVASGIKADGKEYPDPVPAAPPVGYQDPPDLMTTIRRMVHSELFNQAFADAGMETFEEADDFDIDDDPMDPLTDYERVFDPADKPPPGPQVPDAGSPPSSPSPTAQAAEKGGGAGLQPIGGPAPAPVTTPAQSST